MGQDQMWSSKHWVEGDDHFPLITGWEIVDVAQGILGLPCRSGPVCWEPCLFTAQLLPSLFYYHSFHICPYCILQSCCWPIPSDFPGASGWQPYSTALTHFPMQRHLQSFWICIVYFPHVINKDVPKYHLYVPRILLVLFIVTTTISAVLWNIHFCCYTSKNKSSYWLNCKRIKNLCRTFS